MIERKSFLSDLNYFPIESKDLSLTIKSLKICSLTRNLSESYSPILRLLKMNEWEAFNHGCSEVFSEGTFISLLRQESTISALIVRVRNRMEDSFSITSCIFLSLRENEGAPVYSRYNITDNG